MRIIYFFIAFLISFSSLAQMKPVGKVYITEGFVADIDTKEPISGAILYNDSLTITTTTDQNGYFKIAVPVSLIKSKNLIPIDVIKKGYKRNGSAISYNPNPTDTLKQNDSLEITWSYNVHSVFLAKNESHSYYGSGGASMYVAKDEHGPAAVQKSFVQYVAEEIVENTLDSLKEGNDKVYFLLGKQAGIATYKYDIILNRKPKYVFLDGKKITPKKLNKIITRDKLRYDTKTSISLSKKYGKEILSFITVTDQSRENPDVKAILMIDL